MDMRRRGLRLFGPVLLVELRSAARRARFFLLRVAYALLLLQSLWSSQSLVESIPGATTLTKSQNFAQGFYAQFSMLQLTAAIIVSIAVTAGAIAEERKRRTLEFLFTTDLTNMEVVLGKLASRALLVGAVLLTAVPILYMTLFFGGVSGESLLQLAIASAGTVLLCSSFALFISIRTDRPRDAVIRSFILMLAFLVLPWIVLMAGPRAFPTFNDWVQPVNSELLIANPYIFLSAQFGVFFGRASGGWLGLGELLRNQAIASVFLLSVAIWGVRRAHLQARTAVSTKSGGWLRSGVRRKPAIGDLPPMLWKEMYAEPAVQTSGLFGRIALVFILVGVCLSIAVFFVRCLLFADSHYNAETFAATGGVVSVVLSCAFLIITSARAATSITSEREGQTWDELLSTRLTDGEIVLGKAMGSLFAMRWILAPLVGIWVLAIALDLRVWNRALWSAYALAMLGPFYGATGVFFSLRSRNSVRALSGSLLASVFCLGGYYLFLAPFYWAAGGPGRSAEAWFATPSTFNILLWPALSGTGFETYFHPENFIIGTAAYGFAGWALIAWMSGSFDRWTQRKPTRNG
jgi:ABC-type transport system involved in multi-copper enzyme maturation permease subunit